MIPELENEIKIGDVIKSVVPGDIYIAEITAIKDGNKQGESRLWSIQVEYSQRVANAKKDLFQNDLPEKKEIKTVCMQVVQLKLDVGQWVIIK